MMKKAEADKIPEIYREMEKRGFFDLSEYDGYRNYGKYLWMNDMEWMPVEDIINYEYEAGESQDIIPFATTAGGDKWVWVTDRNYYIGICDHADTIGEFYACDLESAILRHIFEYVTESGFYVDESRARSYEISEPELKKRLKDWRTRLDGILKEEYLKAIDDLGKLHLKKFVYGKAEYYGLLSNDELDELIEKYIQFDRLGEEFEWCTMEYFQLCSCDDCMGTKI